jgi:hypothetical protein
MPAKERVKKSDRPLPSSSPRKRGSRIACPVLRRVTLDARFRGHDEDKETTKGIFFTRSEAGMTAGGVVQSDVITSEPW